METTIEERLTTLLKSLPDVWENNQLNKSRVIEAIRNYDGQIIKLLLSDELIRSTYTTEIEGVIIFKQHEFIDYFRYMDYWDSSYTRYSTEIGLTSEGKFLKYNSDVVLDFPFKDTVLEGGMTKEEVGKKEIFYHNILAKDEIDIMLSPKVLNNVKKYDKNGEHEVTEFVDTDNLVIKGNNLVALSSLKERFAGKVKLIYIDPPYNTGGDSFKYNDRFNHSTWLTFMKNRLEIARDLLCDGGSIWINIDDNEAHYLKVLMDGIIPNGFVANVLWQKRTSPDARTALGDAHEHILVYTNDVALFKENLKTLPLTEEQKSKFNNPDDDPKGPWVSSDFTAQGYRPNQMYTIITPSGKEFTPPPGKCWKTIEREYKRLKEEDRMWFGKNGDAMPRRKTYLYESAGRVAWTWWPNKEVGHNQEAKKESIALFGQHNPFSTPKPERLIQRILALCTDENDLVLDFFAGSGTTAAVCHKMNRRYIAIEQLTYNIDYTPTRLRKVIMGEQGGVSKDVDWKGGGSFIYTELLESNQIFIHKIINAISYDSLINVLKELKDTAFFNYKIELDKLLNNVIQSEEISLAEKKKMIIDSLDHNQNYVAYSEIDDGLFSISEQFKAFNNSFYSKEGSKE